jgi:hypothetical protein
MKFDGQNHMQPQITWAVIPALNIKEDNTSQYRHIVLAYASSVIVGHGYMDTIPEGCTVVAELNYDGYGLLRVPTSLITEVYDDDEMDGIFQCIDADERLLSYAQ